MIELNIPGITNVKIENVVFDMNGTLSENGLIKESVKGLLNELSKHASIYIITSDTYNTLLKHCIIIIAVAYNRSF